jgi:hypothetical protein
MFRIIFGSVVLVILAIIIVTLFQTYFRKLTVMKNLEENRKRRCSCELPGTENKFKNIWRKDGPFSRL